jgi:hypothetical protein
LVYVELEELQLFYEGFEELKLVYVELGDLQLVCEGLEELDVGVVAAIEIVVVGVLVVGK